MHDASMIRVFINGRFLGQRLTGVQRYALETLLALDHLIGESRLEAPSFRVLAPRGVTAPKLANIEFEQVGRLSGHAWEQLELPIAARSGWLLSFCATGPLVKRRQTVTIHDAAVYAMPHAFSREFKAWYKLLLPALAKRSPLVMTVSEFSRAELCRYLRLDAARVRVSGEGWQHVQKLEPDPGILERHGLTPGRYVLAVSSLTPQKNFQLLADALPLLRGSGFQVAVAGRLEARVFGKYDASSLNELKLLGYVSDAELRSLYEHAGVFVYPSRYEGFGIPPLEAMALGCPVVASNAASLPEVCGDAALYFGPDDASALANAIRRVMTEPETRRSLVELGRKRLEHHDWENAARVHLGLLAEVAGVVSNAATGNFARTLAAAAKT